MPEPASPTDTTIVSADGQQWSAYALEGLRQFMAGTTSGLWPTNVVYTSNSSTTASLHWGGFMLPQLMIGSSANMLTINNVFYSYQDQNDRPRGVVRDPQPEDAGAQARRQAELAAERIQRREEQARRLAQMQVGEDRARALLLSCLTDEQRAEFEAAGVFHTRSSCGRLFRIEPREVANIIEVDPDNWRRERGVYCVHPHGVPVYDTMLAQKLHIESDVDRLLAIANRHR